MMWRHMTVGAAEVERTCRSKQGDEVSAAAEIKERIYVCIQAEAC